MRLKGPIAKLFSFSSRDHAKPGQFISGPIPPGAPSHVHPYARFTVPFVHQGHVNLCGDACVEMLLAFKGRPYRSELRKNPRGIVEGSSTDDLSERLAAAGVRVYSLPLPHDRRWTPQLLAAFLQKSGPIICQGAMHFVLLTGIHEGHVFIHDPWRGQNLTYTLDEFNRWLAWTSDCMLAASA